KPGPTPVETMISIQALHFLGAFILVFARPQALAVAPHAGAAALGRNAGRPHDCQTAQRALLRSGDAAPGAWRSSAERNVARAPCPNPAARASARLPLPRASRHLQRNLW